MDSFSTRRFGGLTLSASINILRSRRTTQLAAALLGAFALGEPRTARGVNPVYEFSTFVGTLPRDTSARERATGQKAYFDMLGGLACDSAGNIYGADILLNTIRKIGRNGEVTRYAGVTNINSFADGAADAANFSGPTGVAVDAAGNVYVADTYNNVIRKISTSRIVSTLAGSPGQAGSVDGTGAAARFNQPQSIAIDNSGNIFVAESDRCSIRKVTQAGVVTTLVDSSATGFMDGPIASAKFGPIAALCIDRDGNLIVADIQNHAIRLIASNGTVSTLAGGPSSAGTSDGPAGIAQIGLVRGVACGPDGSIYFIEYESLSVRKLSITGSVTTIAGLRSHPGGTDAVGTKARFGELTAIAIAGDGHLFVSDASATLREIATNGSVTTLAGQSESDFADGVGTAARFRQIGQMAIDPSDNIYTGDVGNFVVRKITPTGVVTSIAGMDSEPDVVDGRESAARFDGPDALTLDSTGNLYVCDSGHLLRKISAQGAVTTLVGNPVEHSYRDGVGIDARLMFVSTLATDSLGNMFLSDEGPNTVRKITPALVVSTFAGTPESSGTTDGQGTSARFTDVQAVAVDAADNIIVADGTAFRRITPEGNVSTLLGQQGTATSTDGPLASATIGFAGLHANRGLFVDRAGNILFTDSSTIRMMSFDGVVTTLGGKIGDSRYENGTGIAARFQQPTSIVEDSHGDIFIADSGVILRGRLTSVAVLSQPKSRRIMPGAEVVWTVATANASTFQWTKDGTPITGATSSTLRIVAAKLSDTGDYQLVVTGAGGTTQTLKAKLVVNAVVPPVITFQPHAVFAHAGGSATFAVGITGSEPLSYQWMKDGVVIPGATAAVLNLETLTSDAAGNYSVIVTNSEGSVASGSAALAVDPTPAQASSNLVNISTRSFVGIDSEAMIAGFIVSGSTPKTLLIRASGPALSQFDLGGLLADPTLEIHDYDNVIASNDNWGEAPDQKSANLAAFQAVRVFPWADGSKDAAIVMTLNPGGYTAIVRGKNGATGLALIEVFEIDRNNTGSKLINISTRSAVKNGANVQIAGFVIAGDKTKKVVIRASGPALIKYDVSNTLADPMLEVHDDRDIIATNDNWDSSLRGDFIKLGIDNWAVGSTDAAVALNLNPGSYTAIVSGKGGSSGTALIEVFDEE